ncbi:uncharacterized protein LOC125071302 [Vanessa atalanta]|uniref:uncharacterized protein LOC125071302 n=1 Tax=Vanessa atalanta TaxID=42275 RepID=UPI001FCE1265|nr:uncharacterized protein LOC125071302 [Vanessa atalanta]
MDKENNKSAAGLRRSAIAERLRLREEWSALKGTSNEPILKQNNKNVLTKKQHNLIISFPKKNGPPSKQITKINEKTNFAVSEVLRGTVVLVDVGSEPKALPLRAALTALGASVVPTWSPLVTHLVWSQGGARGVRARARSLACALVSPLWVEACAAARRRLPERVFPAPARASDPPSPAALRRLLRKAEQENISLQNLLSDSVESDKGKPARLRISSETEHDTTNTTDTSHDTSADKSLDKSDRTVSPDPETRVNTAPRRALPASLTPQKPTKSKRKLFTQKEADVNTDDESEKEDTPIATKKTPPKLTQRGRRELARAERIARRLVGSAPTKHANLNKFIARNQNDRSPRIVLTGMSRKERHEIWEAIKQLNGKVQNHVNKKTTHVLMGSCTASSAEIPAMNRRTHVTRQNDKITMCQKCNTPEEILSQMFLNNVTVQRPTETNVADILCTCNNISGVANISNPNMAEDIANMSQYDRDNGNILTSSMEILVKKDKPRTVNALLGAVRGCRVLNAQWARDSVKAKRWLHHFGYEVPHLIKISQKARIERAALCKMHSEYAYDIFNGMRVRVSENAEQKEAVDQLLTLCGAVTQDNRNGAKKQNGGNVTAVFDVTIGRESGQVCSKWVFDSVAAARMRTTRRYVNKDIPTDVITLS